MQEHHDSTHARELPSPLAPVYNTLNFIGQYQQTIQWCWAAATISINHYYVPPSTWTQCKLANVLFGLSDCCNVPTPQPCVRPYYAQNALSQVGALESWTTYAAEYTAIVSQINAQRPIVAQIDWTAGGAHVVTIYGYWYDDATNDFRITFADPYWGDYAMPYKDFPGQYFGGGTWSATMYTKSNTAK